MDPETLRRAQVGDIDAFAEMVAELRGPLMSVCYRILGNLADAEEAVQDALVRLHRALPRVDAEREVFFFARRIAVNESIDMLTQRQRRPHAVGSEDDLAPVVDEAPGPERVARSSELRRRVTTALVHLTPRERAVFVLRGLEEEDFSVIARTLGIQEVTARRLYGLARQRLMKLLGDLRS